MWDTIPPMEVLWDCASVTTQGNAAAPEQKVENDIPSHSVILSMTLLYLWDSVLRNVFILQKPLPKIEPKTITLEFSLAIRFISVIWLFEE